MLIFRNLFILCVDLTSSLDNHVDHHLPLVLHADFIEDNVVTTDLIEHDNLFKYEEECVESNTPSHMNIDLVVSSRFNSEFNCSMTKYLIYLVMGKTLLHTRSLVKEKVETIKNSGLVIHCFSLFLKMFCLFLCPFLLLRPHDYVFHIIWKIIGYDTLDDKCAYPVLRFHLKIFLDFLYALNIAFALIKDLMEAHN